MSLQERIKSLNAASVDQRQVVRCCMGGSFEETALHQTFDGCTQGTGVGAGIGSTIGAVIGIAFGIFSGWCSPDQSATVTADLVVKGVQAGVVKGGAVGGAIGASWAAAWFLREFRRCERISWDTALMEAYVKCVKLGAYGGVQKGDSAKMLKENCYRSVFVDRTE